MSEYNKSRSARKLGPYYCRHIAAMTAEDLYEKSDIAKELAARDERIDNLIVELESNADLLVIAHMKGHHDRDEEVQALKSRFAQAEKLAQAVRCICDVPTHGEFGGPLVYLNAIYEDGSEWRKPIRNPDSQRRRIAYHTMNQLRQALKAWEEGGKV